MASVNPWASIPLIAILLTGHLVGFIPFTNMNPCVVIGYMAIVTVFVTFTHTFIKNWHYYI